MKAFIIENMLGVKCKFSPEVIKKVGQYAPDALKLKSEDGDEYFAVTTARPFSCGEISEAGMAFECYNDAAVVWIRLPSGVEDIKADIKEMYGLTFANLNEVECQIAEIKEDIERKLESVEDSIKIGSME